MKRITIRRDGTESVYATNNSGEGAFRLVGGAYQQLAGNSQTPIFRTPQQLRRWLGRGIGRMVDSLGW